MDQKVDASKSVRDEIFDLIVQGGRIDPAKLTPNATIASLELESIALVMVMMTIEEKFGVYLPLTEDFAEDKTLEQLMTALAKRILEERAQSGG